jgi:hypothetical protein
VLSRKCFDDLTLKELRDIDRALCLHPLQERIVAQGVGKNGRKRRCLAGRCRTNSESLSQPPAK